MKNKFTKSKKGAVTSSIADFWAYVIFVFVIILFYAFFSSQSKDIEANRIQSTRTMLIIIFTIQKDIASLILDLVFL